MRESSIKGEPLAMSTDDSGTPAVSSPSTAVPYARTPSEEEELRNNVTSAFKITSVTTAPTDTDDLETSMRQPGHSADEQQIKANLRSRKESVSEEDEPFSQPEHQRVTSLASSAIPEDEGEPGTPPMVRQTEMKAAQSTSVPLQMQQPVSGIIGVNGPQGQGASRFRRVNNYVRARWTVRDTSEQKPDGDVKGGPPFPQNLRTESNVSPLLQRKDLSDPPHSSDLEFSASHLLSQQPAGGSDAGSDKDATSTVAETETLSRNTSMSSIPTTEKSVDLDVAPIRDLESDQVPSTTSATTAGSTTVVPSSNASTASPATAVSNPNLSEVTYTQSASTLSTPAPIDQLEETVPAPDTAGSDVAMATTHPPSCSCETCAGGVEVKGEGQRSKRVKTYLTNLQEEMNQLLESSANLESLKKENEQLHEENERLKQRNLFLEQEVVRLTAGLEDRPRSNSIGNAS